ncbi:hypothetical protein ACFSTE_21875 [Aquimarina hainanensis]|uniref:Uncharacterized protein n=1 Tax=Aquimarina hainanensis TaxID=1578017 RepID=A0ABW5NEN7_9FLAO|nr:hypothetical protein [Aquimarina sp. TRL1]QKX07355.1 hypothetical protein HN014_21375 [Aquimarina sp. TRL1]
MKKVFVLSGGLEKFSAQEVKNMENIVGGAIYEEEVIYYPTSGGRHCPQGMIWSNALQKCVPARAEATPERLSM